MENLSKALDSLQEELLSLYEKNSGDIADQIRHWNLVRKEQVLFHFARKNGVSRIGMSPVPPQSVSQQKAKSAIEQEILLQSLADSQYGSERWTLSDTSKERLLADPPYCFKKNGKQVDVRFDEQPDNLVRYVLWQYIYFQTESDTWSKTEGKLDNLGLYYLDEHHFKVYYVDFRKEAEKYSKTGRYEVLSKLTTPAVPTSPFAATGPATGGDASTSGATARPSTSKKKALPTTPRRSRRYLRPSSRETPRRRGFGRRREGELAGHSTPSPGLVPPSPGEVGQRTQTTPKGNRTRLARLLLDAKDPPVIILKGGPNSLKCIRYRLKSKFSSLFSRASTTWQWTVSDGTERWGRSRMLLSFKDTAQRELFLHTVQLPKSVQYSLGSFDDL
uniref:Regulatory protein E2 n=1 Tax=Canis familiaris papillomavirus 6 TaxID=1513269 RepID=A0A2P1BRS2_9PAPI|nr:early protein 2 [Canis familiaris papillomavirus 6]